MLQVNNVSLNPEVNVENKIISLGFRWDFAHTR